jgi:predicted molibdopterin-dependent oxidoreductase YjgC
MGVDGNSVVTVNPAAQPDTVNRATLCVRGHFAHDFLNSKERLTQPLIRTGTLAPTTWDAALDGWPNDHGHQARTRAGQPGVLGIAKMHQ